MDDLLLYNTSKFLWQSFLLEHHNNDILSRFFVDSFGNCFLMVTCSDLGLGHTNNARHSYHDDIPFIMALFSQLAFFCLFMVSILQLDGLHGDGLAYIMQIVLYL